MPQRSIEPSAREQLDDPHFTFLDDVAHSIASLQAEGITHCLGSVVRPPLEILDSSTNEPLYANAVNANSYKSSMQRQQMPCNSYRTCEIVD